MRTDNPYITSTQTLLTLLVQVKHQTQAPNISQLHTQFINEIKLVEQQLNQAGIHQRHVLAARYCLCTVIDEAMLSTPWGVQSGWSQQSLLSLFHQETWGGERFYTILESMLNDIRHNPDFIELVYILLSLGFEGKFFNKDQIIREEIRNRIFYAIRNARGKLSRQLSPHAFDYEPFNIKYQTRTALKHFGYMCLSIFLIINLFFNIKLHHYSNPVLDELNKLADISPVTVFSQFTNINRTRPDS